MERSGIGLDALGGTLLTSTGGDSLGAGMLGVLMAHTGVGKTTLLVRLGLEKLLAGQRVLHLSLGTPLEQVVGHYRLQLDARLFDGDRHEHALRLAELARRRLIAAYPEPGEARERLVTALATARDALGGAPHAVLVDGFDWERDDGEVRAELDALLDAARDVDAALWMTVTTFRVRTGPHPTELPPACAGHAERIDLGVFLEPTDRRLAVRVLHNPHGLRASAARLWLDARTLHPILDVDAQPAGASVARPSRATLLSGGAPGAEEAFGACAERWGLAEVTYSFPGRITARRRGLVELGDAALRRGNVSRVYLTAQMNRTYSDDPAFHKVLQTLWHVVDGADEVFAVGAIQADDTVRGGTGWAAELARKRGTPLHVFDQEREAWFRWDRVRWAACGEPPSIATTRFAGTGTRHLRDNGLRAIEALFTASFGTPPTRD